MLLLLITASRDVSVAAAPGEAETGAAQLAAQLAGSLADPERRAKRAERGGRDRK